MAERKNSEKRIATNNRWTNAHYDRINIAVPKGRKDEIKALADTRGQSVNAYIISAVDEKMERDGAGGPQEAAGVAAMAGVSLYPPTRWKAHRRRQRPRERPRRYSLPAQSRRRRNVINPLSRWVSTPPRGIN